jgi:hypothetical protein
MRTALTLTLFTLALPITAAAQTNLCAMLPDTDVGAIIGNPVKLSAGNTNSSALGGGAGTMQSQVCNYNPPRGIGTEPNTAMVTITSLASPTAAAQWFKAQLQFLPGVTGKGEPIAGVGDEALSFHQSGAIYVRRKNVMADVHVGRRDLDLDKEVAMGKAVAQKLVANIQ